MNSFDVIKVFTKIQIELKFYHWKTSSYSRHIASGDLYDSLNKSIDDFVEIYQGKYKKINLDQINQIDLSNTNDNNIIILLEDFKSFLLYDLEDFLSNGLMLNVDLKNLRDEILAKVNKTLYLFTLQ
jgi:hypothetical protein